uniref:ShKT domain-containing protein n=1 Tax=Panagrellus redivivus TaxID=6233 RepID=A0A7E4ZZ00_PANRE
MFYGFVFVVILIFTETSAEFVKLKYPYSPSNEIKFRILDRESRALIPSSTTQPPQNATANTTRRISAAEPVIALANQSNGLSNLPAGIESFIISNETDAIALPEVLTQTDGKIEKESAVRQAIISFTSTMMTFRPPGGGGVTFRPPGSVITTTTATNVRNCTGFAPNGTWSEWVVSEACTADCGACGRQTRTRQCMSYNATTGNGCPCEGVYKQLVPCNINVCNYPWPSCCPPYNLMYVNSLFACGPQSTDTINTFISQSNGSYNRTTGVGR